MEDVTRLELLKRGTIETRLKAQEERIKRSEEIIARGRELLAEPKELFEKMPSDHELLLHFGAEELCSPGLVINEARARASPCTCFTYKKKDFCWSRGVIGMLKQEQEEIYCVAGKTYKAQPKLTQRYTRFAEAAEEAHKKIELMPKGRERLETWLTAMGEELSKRGVEI